MNKRMFTLKQSSDLEGWFWFCSLLSAQPPITGASTCSGFGGLPSRSLPVSGCASRWPDWVSEFTCFVQDSVTPHLRPPWDCPPQRRGIRPRERPLVLWSARCYGSWAVHLDPLSPLRPISVYYSSIFGQPGHRCLVWNYCEAASRATRRR